MPSFVIWKERVDRAFPRLVALVIFAIALSVQGSALAEFARDDGLFVAVGSALAHGRFVYPHLPGAPPAVGIGPAYPALLAAIWRAWPAYPANETLAAMLDALCLGLAAGLAVRTLRRAGVGGVATYVAVPLACVAYPVLAEVGARQALPEFLLLAVGAASVAQSPGVRRAALAGALAGFATLVLGAGVGVLAGLSVRLAFRDRREGLVCAGAGVLVLAPWLAWSVAQAAAANVWYAPVFWTTAGLRHTWGSLGMMGVTLFGKTGGGVVLALAVALATYGWYCHGKTTVLGAALAGGFVAALVLPASTHALWVAVPWLTIGTAAAIDRSRGRARVAVTVAAAVLISLAAVREVIALSGRGIVQWPERAARDQAIQLTAFLVEQPAGEPVATAEAPRFFLATGRLAVPALAPGEDAAPADSIVRRYCDANVALVAVPDSASTAARAVTALEARQPHTLQPLYRLTQGIALYRFQCAR